MAIKGEFTADFSSFVAAVDAADVKLQGFQANSRLVETSLTRMANALQGNKMIADATLMAEAVERIGGVSKLTEAELEKLGTQAAEAIEKMHAAGEPVPANLQKIADEAKNAKGAWGELVAGFNVEEAVTHPLQFAQQSVAALAESMGPLGVAIAGATGIVTGLGAAIYELTAHSAEVGARIQDVSEKTGLSVPTVSRYTVALKAMGADMGEVSNALFRFGQNIGQGSAETEKGLARIGLSVENVQKTRMDDWLGLVAEKFADTGSQAQRNAALVEIFGRQGRDLGPILLKLNDALQQTASITPWTETQAAAAEHLELQLGSIKTKAEAFAVAFGSVFIGPLSTAIDWISKLGTEFDKVDKATHGWVTTALSLGDSGNWIGKTYDYATTGVSTFVSGVGDLPPVAKMSTIELDNMSQSLKKLEIQPKTLSIQEQSKAISELDSQYQKITAQSQHWAGIMGELTTAGSTVQQTIDTIDGSVVEAIQYYLAAGVSQHTLAEAYDLTATQVKAVDTRMKEYSATLKAVMEVEKQRVEAASTGLLGLNKTEQEASQKRMEAAAKAADQLITINKQLTDDYNKQVMDRATYEENKIWEAADVQIEAFKKTGATAQQVTQFSDMVYEHAANTIAALALEGSKAAETGAKAINHIWDTFDSGLRGAAGTSAQVAQAAAVGFDSAMRQAVNVTEGALDNITQDGIDAMNRLLEAQQRVVDAAARAAADAAAKLKAANTFQGGTKLPGSHEETAFGQTYLVSPTGARVPLGPHGELPDNWFEMYSGKSSFSDVINSLPRFASGGSVASGSPYIVGEQGPELFVPTTSGSIVPNGGGGTSVVNHFYVNGTAEDVARKISASIMRSLQSTQQLGLR